MVIGNAGDLDAVPAWASQAARNMDAAGVVNLYSIDNWNGSVTRADAAQMLDKSIEVYIAGKEKAGLLSWVFGW